MHFARIGFPIALIIAMTACSGSSTGGGATTGAIKLSPSGTAAFPVYESIDYPFALSATEGGYSGNFTARKVSGECFKVQPPATSAGYWEVAPDSGLCVGGTKGSADEFEVTDTDGHSAVTYITTKI